MKDQAVKANKRIRAAKTRKVSRSAGGTIAIFICLLPFIAMMIVPIYYAIIQSLKPMDEIFAFPPKFYVVRPTMENYSLMFTLLANMWVPFSRYLFNTVFVTIVATVGHILIAAMAAYPLSKFQFKLSWLNSLVVWGLMFTTAVLSIPQYLIMARLGMINTIWVYIIPSLGAPMGVFLMKNTMDQIPFALIESARMDGAGHFKIFWKIIMPQVKPAWLTLLVFTFSSVWAQSPTNLVFDENIKLLSMAIGQITSAGIARTGVANAAAVFMMLPSIIIFLFSQSSMVETMSHSGIKE